MAGHHLSSSMIYCYWILIIVQVFAYQVQRTITRTEQGVSRWELQIVLHQTHSRLAMLGTYEEGKFFGNISDDSPVNW